MGPVLSRWREWRQRLTRDWAAVRWPTRDTYPLIWEDEHPTTLAMLRQVRQESEQTMRTRAKVDGNQAEIVGYIRARGWSVQSLAPVGKGCPDLLIGRSWLHAILEVKMPKEELNEVQREWHRTWTGRCYIVHTLKDVEFALTELEAFKSAADTAIYAPRSSPATSVHRASADR